MKTYIYFVRHAISPFSLDNERDRGLSEKGKEDSSKIVELLKGEEIDRIVSSTFARAIDTVQPLADLLNLEIYQYEELAERAIASLRYEISEQDLLQGIERSFTDLDYCMSEGETTRQAQTRAIPVIHELLKENQGKKIVVGTHGNIMTIILNYFNSSFGYNFWLQTSKPDIYRLEFVETKLTHVERLWKA